MSDCKRAESSTCTGELGIPPEWLDELAGATLPLGRPISPAVRTRERRGVRGLPWHGDSWVGPQRRFPTSPVLPSGRPLLALGLVPWSLAARPLVAWLFACSCGGGFSSPAH